MATFIINVDTDKVIKQKHISYYTTELIKDDRSYIVLHEIVERWYNHPQANGEAIIPRIEDDDIKQVLVNDKKAAPLFLLQHMMDTISIIEKDGK